MRSIETGRMRHRIRVMKMAANGQVDDLGQDAVEEVEVGRFWASIETRTGSLLKGRTADTVLSETTHIIKLRCNDKITADCWIEHGGFRFEIDYISPDFERKWMEVFARGTQLGNE